MTDGEPATYTPFSAGQDPASPIDRAITATQTAVFPEHGLWPA
jgi:acetoin utilization protein AcuC